MSTALMIYDLVDLFNCNDHHFKFWYFLSNFHLGKIKLSDSPYTGLKGCTLGFCSRTRQNIRNHATRLGVRFSGLMGIEGHLQGLTKLPLFELHVMHLRQK